MLFAVFAFAAPFVPDAPLAFDELLAFDALFVLRVVFAPALLVFFAPDPLRVPEDFFCCAMDVTSYILYNTE